MSLISILEKYAIPSGPGLACTVINNGKVIDTQILGCTNIDTKALITPDTAFRLASVSKQFVAAGILMLIQDQKLSFDDTLSGFFPAFPEYGKQITIWHLLTHTSGLLDYEELLPLKYEGHILDEEVRALMIGQIEGYFAPGLRYRYSNTGYCLLHLIIEHVSMQSLGLFLTERIFVPLDMENAFVHTAGMPDTNIAYGHSLRNETYVLNNHDATSWTIGDGGIYASITDLSKWSAVYSAPHRLGTYDLSQMFQPQVLTDEQYRSYGYGLVVVGTPEEKIIYHEGETVGSRTCVYYTEAEQLFIAVELNRDNVDPLAVCKEIAAAFIR